MKIFLLSVLVLVESILGAYNWNQYCSLDYPIYNANFEFENTDIICTDGLLIQTNNDWEFYDNSGLPAVNAVKLDEDNLLVLFGNGSFSDGLYNFNLITHEYELIDWFPFPQFLYYNTTDHRYYLGAEAGLFRSYNGLKWVKDNSFQYGPVFSMNNQNENFVASNEQGIYNWAYTEVPDFAIPEDLGLLELDEIDEASGIVASRINPNVFWTFNDSGSDPVVYAFNSTGEHLGSYTIEDISNRDWEDIAIGGGPECGEYIYIGDIGDNDAQYDSKYIYRFEEPYVDCNQAPVCESIVNTQTISVQYPDGNHDAETLMHDPLTNDLYIVSKRVADSQGGTDSVYRAEFPQSTTGTIILEDIGELDYPASLVPFGSLYYGATGGEISPLGDEILIKTYSHVYHWKRYKNQSLAETFQNNYNSVNYIMEPQGEAICWEPFGNGYFTISEEPNALFPAHLYFYDLNSWQLANEYTAVEGFQFTSDGILYAFMPGESYSSGLYSSEDFGVNWDVCFWDINISSLALDCDNNVFLGWDNEGVGLWEFPMTMPLMMNDGLEDLNILNMVNFPIVDCQSVLACTQSGAYFISEYTDSEDQQIPSNNCELNNYPNPFNPSTTIRFEIKERENGRLTIFNLKGQIIESEVFNAGQHSYRWDGAGRGTGLYFYQLRTDSEVFTRKMIMIK